MIILSDSLNYHYVYLVREMCKDGYYKIGITNKLVQRMHTLQTGNPRKLELVDTIRTINRDEAILLESILHQYLAKQRAGGEWFSNDGDEDITDIFLNLKEQIGR